MCCSFVPLHRVACYIVGTLKVGTGKTKLRTTTLLNRHWCFYRKKSILDVLSINLCFYTNQKLDVAGYGNVRRFILPTEVLRLRYMGLLVYMEGNGNCLSFPLFHFFFYEWKLLIGLTNKIRRNWSLYVMFLQASFGSRLETSSASTKV